MKEASCIAVVVLAAASCSPSSLGLQGAAVVSRIAAPSMQFLHFDGSGQEHVDHGMWNEAGVALGPSALLQAWIENDVASPCGYVVSTSYSGEHSWLTNGCGGGNYWNGSAAVSYGSDDAPPPGWFEESVSFQPDGGGTPSVVVRMNGVPVGMAAQQGPRVAPQAGVGGDIWFTGGSSHINWSGWIAQLRVYETWNPFAGAVAYVPERQYSSNNDSGYQAEPDMLIDYTRPSLVVADLSSGYGGGNAANRRVTHPGRPSNSDVGLVVGFPTEQPGATPLPTWQGKTDHPFGTVIATPPGTRGLVPASPPTGARVFDSFQRDDQTYAYSNAPTLGMTEAGSLGRLAWQQGCVGVGNFPSSWGVFNGAAVYLEQAPCVAWVATPAGDVDVQVDGRLGNWGNGDTSVAFRVCDAANWWYAQHTWNSAGGGYLSLGYYAAGQLHDVADVPGIARGQHTVRVVVHGNAIAVYLDGIDVRDTVDGALAGCGGTGFAIANNGATDAGLGRWDNFTVR